MGTDVPTKERLPSPLGNSTGRWDGSTLVVTTTGVNWPHFDTVGIPLSEAVEIAERFTPSEDGSRLDYRMTVTDPATFSESVELEKYWLWIPDIEVGRYECTLDAQVECFGGTRMFTTTWKSAGMMEPRSCGTLSHRIWPAWFGPVGTKTLSRWATV